MLYFGPGDFSQGIGAPGDWNHPKLIETRKRVAEVANKYGKFAGTTGGPDAVESFREMGYHFVSVGADVVGMSAYFKHLVSSFNKKQESGFSGNATYK